MNSFSERLSVLKQQLPEQVKIVAVSKTKPVEAIMEAYQAGQRLFGENKVQEILNKHEHLPSDIEWHLIGHLQTNKVKQVLPFVSMIHSLDSVRLMEQIQKQAIKINKVVPCLIQVHIATEETKYGFDIDDVKSLFNQMKPSDYPNIRFSGLMGMASFVEDEEQISQEFSHLLDLFNYLKTTAFSNDPEFCELSMGMTGDYHLAIQQGSTMIRVGTLLFGSR